jgi:4-hydroxybenzoate polyprenyltransferase
MIRVLQKVPLYFHILALRPHQWTKNLIVFAAPLFAFSVSWLSLFESFTAFVLFCSVSSSFYLINDIADVESDRQHPTKCKRPIASGMVSIPVASTMAIVLMGGALGVAYWQSPRLGLVMTCYALLQVAYNLRLKRTVILDVIAIASGFILRALAGAVATDVKLSAWFLLCTAMLALFLGIEKRKAELRLASKGHKTRSVLKKYSLSVLNRMENVVTTSVVMCYALWSSGPKVGGASTSWMLLTLPFVLYGVFRYQLLSDHKEPKREGSTSSTTRRKTSERPEEILLTDLPILLTVIGWIVTSFLILLVKHQGLIE